MLIKEYRIPLPLTVEEYRIAQLYMIQKKSQQETHGAGSGVEILINEPYENGPGGKGGQYTYKIYHIGSHLPAWLRAILPSALRVEEEAWNAYPYTRTKYTCPFVERFVLDVETRYFNDAGFQQNVFNLSDSELQERIIDRIDIVKDSIPPNEYKADEDPKTFRSKKTGRGPLTDDWVQSAVHNCTPIMCSYKLCKVEFRYWGMQTKIEKYIHEHILRRTMLHAHRQAWAWQDEWYGLTIDDIRRLEREAQEILNEKMAAALRAENELTTTTSPGTIDSSRKSEPGGNAEKENTPTPAPGPVASSKSAPLPAVSNSDQIVQQHARLDVNMSGTSSFHSTKDNHRRGTLSPVGSQRSLLTQTSSLSHVDPLHSIRTDTISDDEFFDAADSLDDDALDTPVERPTVVRWSSVEMLAIEEDGDDQNPSPPNTARQTKDGITSSGISQTKVDFLILVFHGGTFMDSSGGITILENSQAKQADVVTLKSTFDNVIRAHYSNLFGRLAFRLVPCPSSCIVEALAALANVCPYGAIGETHFSNTDGGQISYCHHLAPAIVPLLAVSSPAYNDAVSSVLIKAQQIYGEFLQSEEGLGFAGEVIILGDAVGGLLVYDGLVRQRSSSLSRNPSLTSSQSEVVDVTVAIPENEVLTTAIATDFIADKTIPVAGTIQYNGIPNHARVQRINHQQPVLLERRASSPDDDQSVFVSDGQTDKPKRLPAVGTRRSATSSSSEVGFSFNSTGGYMAENIGRSSSAAASVLKFDFRVSHVFLCGTPLALVLAHRQLARISGYSPFSVPVRPLCGQVYNLYYATDPCCARLEPLLARQFARIAPINVPRYQRFPLGDGQSINVVDCIQKHLEEFQQASASCCSPTRSVAINRPNSRRRFSGLGAADDNGQAISNTGGSTAVSSQVVDQWWGTKRVDYALYCPEGLTSFPTVALPNVLHASFWESPDLAALVIRQFMIGDTFSNSREGSPGSFVPSKPTEKWLRRRTSFKIKNSAANHRGNDVIVAENQPQVLQARFMYGSLDVVALTGEKVDIYIIEKPSENGEWIYYGTETTDNHGRLSYTIPVERRLPYGLYPVKMVVLGDHTYQDMYLAVLPPKTECVVFSIDGSFTASVSVSGKDPKVRPGAVDVVRHWQDLGYLILYITARPDMQQRRVLAWLAQHNFPHGLLYFTDGISTEPLRHKTHYLKRLVNECGIHIQAAYGSAKDVNMYKEVGLTAERIFVVGKASIKKYAGHAILLSDGYAAHLNMLNNSSIAVSRPAQGNGRLLIRTQSFGLPGQYQHRAVAVQRSQSFTPRTNTGPTYSVITNEKSTTSLTVPCVGASSQSTSQPGTPHTARSVSPFTRLLSRKGRSTASSTQHQSVAEQE